MSIPQKLSACRTACDTKSNIPHLEYQTRTLTRKVRALKHVFSTISRPLGQHDGSNRRLLTLAHIPRSLGTSASSCPYSPPKPTRA